MGLRNRWQLLLDYNGIDLDGNGVTSLDVFMILQAAAGTPNTAITWYSYDEGGSQERRTSP